MFVSNSNLLKKIQKLIKLSNVQNSVKVIQFFNAKTEYNPGNYLVENNETENYNKNDFRSLVFMLSFTKILHKNFL